MNRVLLLVSFAVACQGSRVQQAPDEVARVVVNAPHGIDPRMSPEIEPLLKEISRRPDVYVPLFAKSLSSETAATADTDEPAIAAAVLVMHLGEKGRVEAEARLRALLVESDPLKARLDAPDIKDAEARQILPRVSKLVLAAGSIFRAFTQAKDPRVKDLALERLTKKDIDLESVAIRSVQETFPDDVTVQEAIRKYKGGE